MKKNAFIIILLAFVWISGLIILTFSLTDLWPNNPFKEHGFIIGFGFITMSGFIKRIYNSIIKKT